MSHKVDEESVPPKVVYVREGMTNGQRWFIIVALVIAGLAVIGALTSRMPTSSATSVVPTQSRSTGVQGGTGGQQLGSPTGVAPVDQAAPNPAPIQTVYAYSNNDYLVGNGEGQMPAGRYRSDGDNSAVFKVSMWTTYSDLDKQHVLDFGSIGESQQRFMTVAKNAKVVSLSGSAAWIKVG